MTLNLILDLHQDIMKRYLPTKNEGLQKLEPDQDMYTLFWSCDLDFDLVTLTYESGLDILKLYLYTKIEVSRSRLSKVRAQTGQTDTHRDRRD